MSEDIYDNYEIIESQWFNGSNEDDFDEDSVDAWESGNIIDDQAI